MASPMDRPPRAGMMDMAFAVAGRELPADYRQALWDALRPLLPWLEDEPDAGIHGIRTVATDYGVALLPRRARLTLRLPQARLAAAEALAGRRIEVDGNPLLIGAALVRELSAATTLYADFVSAGATDEPGFARDLNAALAQLGTPCQHICGRRRSLRAEGRELSGYAVALHGLGADASLRLQCLGVGPARKLGCGIFVPHKTISGLV